MGAKGGDGMACDAKAEKRRIRGEMARRAAEMGEDARQTASAAIAAAVLESGVYREAESIFVYLGTDREPDTDAIVRDALARDKAVYVPQCVGPHHMQAVRITADSAFIAGAFGIREPADISDWAAPEDMDLCLVPCVSVTTDGVRLGHGGGYYDAFLARCRGYRLCLCFAECISPALPAEEHDAVMDAVCTERGLFPCR